MLRNDRHHACLVGVDNDAVECETMAPPLSSLAVPWRSVGESAASLVQLGLRGKAIAGTRVLVAPVDVVVRRSSDTLVEVARRLLATTDAPLAQVAKSSGFTNVALLSVAFRRELGVPPGAYRRSPRGLFAAGDE